MSATTEKALPPALSTSATIPSARPLSMSTQATVAPASASLRDVIRPWPARSGM